MNKKLLITVSLIAGQAMAMEPGELTIPSEQSLLKNTAEKMVTIQLQGGEAKELPIRYISLSSTLKNLVDDLGEAQEGAIPLPEVNLETWLPIENQLERVYRSTHGETQLRDEIIAEYAQLASRSLIDLIGVVEYLDIPLLKEIILGLAQNKLTYDEILTLSSDMRNEVIKRKVYKIVGPVPLKEQSFCPGNQREILSICVTHDNKIVTSSYDGIVRIWDMSGNQLAVCEGHEMAVHSVCVTQDNKIVSGSHDNTVRVWDMSGNQLAVCRGHKRIVWSVCVTPDNKIISGSEDNTVRVWDMNGKELAICGGLKDGPTRVCITPDGKIVSASRGLSGNEGDVRIWDMNGEQLAAFKVVTSLFYSVCATHDNKIVCGNRIYDMNGEKRAVFSQGATITSVCPTQDNKIVTGSFDGIVRIWDLDGKELAVCRDHKPMVWEACVTQDNKIVSGSIDGTMRISDISDIRLFDRLSVMSKKQAELIGRMLDWTERLLNRLSHDQEAKACEVISEYFWKSTEEILEKKEIVVETKNIMLSWTVRLLICLYQAQEAKACAIIFAQCGQEIAKIFEEEVVDSETKKRKELENSDNNPAKKVRHLEEEELVIERNHE